MKKFSAKLSGVPDHIVEQVCLFLHLTEWDYLASDYGPDILESRHGAAGRCYEVSLELIDFLADLVPEAHLVECWKWNFYCNSSHAHCYHCMAKIEDWIVDLTGAQFGEEYAGARFLTEEQLENEWDMIIYRYDKSNVKNGCAAA